MEWYNDMYPPIGELLLSPEGPWPYAKTEYRWACNRQPVARKVGMCSVCFHEALKVGVFWRNSNSSQNFYNWVELLIFYLDFKEPD